MFQSVTIVGSAGADALLRYTPSGTAVASFSVAANRQYKGADGQQVKETVWLKVATFGKLGEICGQYVKKGNTVLVVGRLSADPATGGPKVFQKKDGSWGASYEIIADTVRFLSSHKSQDESKEEDTPEF